MLPVDAGRGKVITLVGIPQYLFITLHMYTHNPRLNLTNLRQRENSIFQWICSNPNFHVFLLEWIVPGGVFWWLVGQYNIIMRCLPAMNTLSGLPRDGIKHIGMKTQRAT